MRSTKHSASLLTCLTLQTALTCFLVSVPISILAQEERDRWQRVYTGEDSLIEINVQSLRFEPEHILRVRFRTVLSKPESLGDKSETKYKNRVETILFKSHERRYRFDEISWLDSMGNIVHSYKADSAGDWKVLKEGGMMERMFYSIGALPPFGSWKVVDYRFGDGAPNGAIGVRDVARLIGDRVRLGPERADVGAKVCQSPSYQSKRFTKQESSRELGIQLESIGIKSSYADTIIVKCEGNGWAPPQSMLIELPENQMLILWNGLFLVLGNRERFQNASPSILKRRLPNH